MKMISAKDFIGRPVKEVTSVRENILELRKELLEAAKHFIKEGLNSNNIDYNEMDMEDNTYIAEVIFIRKFKDSPEKNIGNLDRYMLLFHNINFPTEEFFKWLNSFGWYLYEDLIAYNEGEIQGVIGLYSFEYTEA